MSFIPSDFVEVVDVGLGYPIPDPTTVVDVQDWCLAYYINYLLGHPIMVTGIKRSSSEVQISSGVTETAPGVFTQVEVDLSLSPLDNEVFVVTAIDLDLQAPDAIAATNTDVTAYVSSTSQTATVGIDNSNCLTSSRKDIRALGFVDGGVGFDQQALTSPQGETDYLGIIATNNFFIGIQGANNLVAKRANCRLYGYRATANASVYSALVQSEVLSA